MNNLHDMAWLILCGILAVLMQPGFACLVQSWLVQAKNSINVEMTGDPGDRSAHVEEAV